MADSRMRIRGLRQLNEALEMLGDPLAGQALRGSLREGAKVIALHARTLARQRQPGTKIPRSIYWGVRRTRRGQPPRAGIYFRRAPMGAPNVAPHAHLLESGTKERFTKRGKYRGRVAPRRFMQDAVEAKQGEAMRAISVSMSFQMVKAIRSARMRTGKIADRIESSL